MSADDQFPAIYTSEDEHINTPSPKQNHNNDPSFHSSTQEATQKVDDGIDAVPIKMPRLTVTSSLVSYTLDDDDDETNVEHDDDIDDAGSRSEESEPNSKELSKQDDRHSSSSPEAHNFGFTSTTEPPTIFSSEHQQIQAEPIHVLSQDQLSNMTTQKQVPEAPVEVSSSELKKDDLSLTERLMRDIVLPPEPTGLCARELQERVDRAVHRMRLDISFDPNRTIQDNKSFRNPSIYEKLIAFLNIDEKGTNFAPDVYNPYRWTSQSYYDELARIQNREIDRLTKLQKDQKKSDSTSGTNSQSNESTNPNLQKSASTGLLNSEKSTLTTVGSVSTLYTDSKKPSKWDSGAPVNPPNLPNPDPIPNESTKLTVPPVGSLIRQK